METLSTLNEQKLAYTAKEFSSIIGIAVPTLAKDRVNGCLGGIPYVKIGGRILYVRSVIVNYLERLSSHPKSINQMTTAPNRTENHDNKPKRTAGRPKGTTKKVMKQRRIVESCNQGRVQR